MSRKRIDHNNLLPWFTRDHKNLPSSYLASCRKFFDELQAASRKQQASSSKQVTSGPDYDINQTERKI